MLGIGPGFSSGRPSIVSTKKRSALRNPEEGTPEGAAIMHFRVAASGDAEWFLREVQLQDERGGSNDWIGSDPDGRLAAQAR